ncbi:MAG: cell division protein FtsH [Verrucomicrobiales bacterium]|nr:cell division protein FtsH [Verrucomicrobiales bacterium]|tara:strand:+ start:1886 stop:3931 length:2046 start_codon:yes stop_codon:yes gene_type:complete
MSEHPNNNNNQPEDPNEEPRNVYRPWLVWVAILGFIPLLIVLRDSSDSPSKDLPYKEFQEYVAEDLIDEGTLTFDPQSPKVVEIAGTVFERDTGGRTVLDSNGKQKVKRFRLMVPYHEDKIDELASSGKFKVVRPNTFLWSFFVGVLPFVLIFLFIYFFFVRQIKMAGKGALSFGKSKARMLSKDKNKTTFKDVAGVDEAREEVEELVEFLKDPKKFQKLGGRIPKGVLMVGSPGTGKTLLAKAIAGEADASFFSISGSDFVEMFVGVGASRVRDMFEQARKSTPCLIFIDEIDAVGRSRGHGLGGGNDEREQTLNALLVEMDGFDSQEGIIIIAATNRPDVLDPALLRPGRFDRQVTVALPDVRGREAILKVHAKNVKLAPDVDLAITARGTPGYSGAELANLLNEAALLAARANKKYVTQAELEEARDKVRWGRERRTLAMTDEDKRRTAWHEAGHAILNVLLDHMHPLHKVTIIPRGQSLGSTMYLPKDDTWNHQKKEMLDLICMTMGGRIAEEMHSGDISTGAAGDIQQATKTAKSMVTQFGMSEKLGMVHYGESQEYLFLGRDMARGSEYSENTAQEIDAEVKRIIDGAYNKATQLLTENKDKLEIIANALLEYETLEGAQVEEIVRTGEMPKPPEDKADSGMTGAEASTPLPPELPKEEPPEIGPGLGSPAPAPV